ncbi:hypothetical protein Ciccas_011687, partial [Cichlidogyrus casuarinus]
MGTGFEERKANVFKTLELIESTFFSGQEVAVQSSKAATANALQSIQARLESIVKNKGIAISSPSPASV